MRRFAVALFLLCVAGWAQAHGPYPPPRVIYYDAPVYRPPVVIHKYDAPRYHRPAPPPRYAWRDHDRRWASPPRYKHPYWHGKGHGRSPYGSDRRYR